MKKDVYYRGEQPIRGSSTPKWPPPEFTQAPLPKWIPELRCDSMTVFLADAAFVAEYKSSRFSATMYPFLASPLNLDGKKTELKNALTFLFGRGGCSSFDVFFVTT